MKTTTRRLVAGMAVAGVFGAVALSRATLHAATATATLTVQNPSVPRGAAARLSTTPADRFPASVAR